jgi:hypothetical protein
MNAKPEPPVIMKFLWMRRGVPLKFISDFYEPSNKLRIRFRVFMNGSELSR